MFALQLAFWYCTKSCFLAHLQVSCSFCILRLINGQQIYGQQNWFIEDLLMRVIHQQLLKSPSKAINWMT